MAATGWAADAACTRACLHRISTPAAPACTPSSQGSATELQQQEKKHPQQQPFSNFCMQHDLLLGTLTILPAQPADVGPASVLLTRAFAGSLQGVPIQDARQYCQACLTQPPRGVLLVARLQPAGKRAPRAVCGMQCAARRPSHQL